MARCLVVCSECHAQLYGAEPHKIEYRMVILGQRLRPVCEGCYEDRRTTVLRKG